MRRVVLAFIIGALLLRVPPSRAATVSGTMTIGDTRAEGAVVYLEDTQHPVYGPEGAHAVMDQKDLAFVPRVLPVVRGTVVEFTNSDNVLHNVFTPSAVAGKFDLGTYSQGEARSITLDKPGEVLILCNIHMEMAAHILVLNDPYFAVVARDGSYQIPAVPPGTYVLRVWREGLLRYTQTLQVPATGTLTVELQVER
ncbi:MAG TPA: carboxypeptidase regulatory-like domain-containing protein [Candidatus Binatia bacterium]|jgi:plastocyanin|nr:carboxypeptidase regulatory-like domain-containing protein [Candidatus Binatia bacterium]